VPTTTATFFISAVTDEFGSYRGELDKNLDRPGVRIETQEKFLDYGDAILLELDEYIAQCDAVIHLAGDRTGSIASKANREKLIEKRPDLPEKLGLDVRFVSPSPALGVVSPCPATIGIGGGLAKRTSRIH